MILDELNNPVNDATVEILIGETRVARVSSSSDGSFEFSSRGAVGAEGVTLAVDKDGYTSEKAIKAADAEDLEKWVVVLKRSPSVAVKETGKKPPNTDHHHDNKVLWLALAGVAILLVVGAVAFALLRKGGNPEPAVEHPSVTVARVIGMELGAAQQKLRNTGLLPEDGGTMVTGSVAPGQVSSQDPGPGEEAPQGAVVTLVVEESSVVVPNVMGMELSTAMKKLTDLQLKPDQRGKAVTGQFPPGRVAIQLPEGGGAVPPGTSITLVVEDQPHAVSVTVPNLIGKSERQAVAVIKAARLVPEKSARSMITRKLKPGQVARQVPSAGLHVQPGSSVTYFLEGSLVLIPPLGDRPLFFDPTKMSRPAHTVSITSLAPDSPARLSLKQKVRIRFKYSTTQSGGVRIFVRPMTGKTPTPGYVASASPLYRTGNGSGQASFSITRGSGTIDQLRVQIWTADQKKMLRQFFRRVQYRYGK